MSAIVNVFEQELFGTVHWRVMRKDGQRIFGDRIMTDFPTESEALSAIEGDFRRNKLGDFTIVVKRR